MCNEACIGFIREGLSREEVSGRRVLEVGARNVNGSPRDAVSALSPASYTGVDIAGGPGVDEVCDVTGLAARFGPAAFDIVISTEMLEHVRDWRGAVSNLKAVLKPGGLLLLTTRSAGYPYHGYPYDFWRYEDEDIRAIFSDMNVLATAADPLVPGIFMKARMPKEPRSLDLSSVELFSIVTGDRRRDISTMRLYCFRLKTLFRSFLSAVLPPPLKHALKKLFSGPGGAGDK